MAHCDHGGLYSVLEPTKKKLTLAREGIKTP
jgi:hypothetical protein